MNAEIQAIAEYYGVTSQQNKTIEEMAELIQALIKGDREAVIEELADVKIMIAQLEYFIGPEKVKPVVNYKLARQVRRIAEEQESEAKSNGRKMGF